MARVLVLNASYEPLSVVSTRRAVVLVLRDKATVVAGRDELWASASQLFDVPSVVKLTRYVKVPYRRSAPVSRRAVFGRDGHRCQYCGGPAESIDHVLPKSKGGDHTWENVVACCRACNVRKADHYLAETRMKLAAKPQVPRRHDWVVASTGFPIDPSWHRYLLADSA